MGLSYICAPATTEPTGHENAPNVLCDGWAIILYIKGSCSAKAKTGLPKWCVP